MKKSFIHEINENIKEVELLLKESMNFYEDSSNDNEENFDVTEDAQEYVNSEQSDYNETPEFEENNKVESYMDNIRKYALNGLSALCDTPENEEYQMLKKIFQMCDRKPEKKNDLNESTRLFGVSKENKKVLFETYIDNVKDFKLLKSTLIKEANSKGIDTSDIRLVSEKKIIR